MGFMFFGLRRYRKPGHDHVFFSYSVNLTLMEEEAKAMGWQAGEPVVCDWETGTISKPTNFGRACLLKSGPYNSVKVVFQSLEPSPIHQNAARCHCRRAKLDAEGGKVSPGEIDDTLNRNPYFEKQKGKRSTDGRRQTIWKPSKKAQDALYVNRVERGLRGTARDFRHTADIVKTPEVDEK